jgi:hypothetical protein
LFERFRSAVLACLIGLNFAPVGAQTSATTSRLDKPVADSGASCPRACLLGIASLFGEAVTNNDVSKMPLATDVRLTSDGKSLPLGKGRIWGTSRRMPFREVFVDPKTGAIVFYAFVNGVNTPGWGPTPPPPPTEPDWKNEWIYVARLKVVKTQIEEIEEPSFHPEPDNFFASGLKSLTLPDRIWDAVEPESERVTRQQLFGIADRYSREFSPP